MVPPSAKVAALNDSDIPPVLPPVHPLTTSVADPVIVVQEMELAVHEYTNDFSAVITPAWVTHTSPVEVAGSRMPSPVSPVTADTTDSAEGLVAV
jgi:hypothetical protein